MEVDNATKVRVVYLILEKKPEEALGVLSALYGVKAPILRVGTVRGRRKALAVYVHHETTIYASNSDVIYDPHVVLHEFYHHIRSNFGEHRGTEKNADAFANEFLKAYLSAQKHGCFPRSIHQR